MLFDLRGRGRRRTVQVIYLSLAILMGGGLVLFGIGGATPGGLVDAVTGSGGGGVGASIYEDRVKKLNAKVAANPKDDQAWADLAKAQVQQASVTGYDQATGRYTQKGIQRLRLAANAWRRYIALDPKKPDDRVASLMVSAYGTSGLNIPKGAADALEAVIEGRGASAALYTQLAVTTYLAGDPRRSLIAERRAIELTPKAKRKLTEANISSQRRQIDRLKVQGAVGQQQGPATTPLGN